MSAKSATIRAIYAQVAAPPWAAPNLDGLTDVLRDLSWLPEGPVLIIVPDLGGLSAGDHAALCQVLADAVEESSRSPRPVRIQ